MSTKRVYIPLQGPDGVRPKAPAVGAWQSPGYIGLTLGSTLVLEGMWIGMRCDGLVVIDCDSQAASLAWREIDQLASTGWVRKTPRGYHYIYRQTPDSPDGPAVGLLPGLDIRAGRTSQIVMYAPDYQEMHGEKYIRDFEPAWLKGCGYGEQVKREDEEWDEIPDGRGNTTMTAFAGAFRKQGMSKVVMAKCLGAINRITMVSSPMPNADIAQIVLSVSRYAAAPDVDIEVEA